MNPRWETIIETFFIFALRMSRCRVRDVPLFLFQITMDNGIHMSVDEVELEKAKPGVHPNGTTFSQVEKAEHHQRTKNQAATANAKQWDSPPPPGYGKGAARQDDGATQSYSPAASWEGEQPWADLLGDGRAWKAG